MKKNVKTIVKVAAAIVACAAVAVIVFGHVTGDQLLMKEKKNMVEQSYVTMDESNINALMGGQIREVLVEEGDYVKKGQPLVNLDSDTLLAQKEQAEAALAQAQAACQILVNGTTEEQMKQLDLAVGIAQANLATAEAAYNDAQNNLNRTQALYNSGDLPKVQFDSAESAVVSARSAYENAQSSLEISKSKLLEARNGATPEQLAQAQAGVDQAKASVKQIQTNLDKCTLTSPIDGLITTVNVKNGDVVSSGLPAVVVADVYTPYITCNIDETKLERVKLDQDVNISLAALDGRSYPGKVVKINKAADFATKKASNEADWDILTYGIKVVFDNPQELEAELRAGMTAYVDFGK